MSFMDVMALGVQHPVPTDVRELAKGKLLKKRLKAVNAARCCASGEGTSGGNRRAKAISFVIRTYKTNGRDTFDLAWSGEWNCVPHTINAAVVQFKCALTVLTPSHNPIRVRALSRGRQSA
jgi:hypothetical protein